MSSSAELSGPLLRTDLCLGQMRSAVIEVATPCSGFCSDWSKGARAMEKPLVYSLEDACKLFFPNVPITPKDLRKEARRGRLTITRINRQECVSEQALREMLAACQERKAQPDSGLSAGEDASQSGISSTPDAKLALAAAPRRPNPVP